MTTLSLWPLAWKTPALLPTPTADGPSTASNPAGEAIPVPGGGGGWGPRAVPRSATANRPSGTPTSAPTVGDGARATVSGQLTGTARCHFGAVFLASLPSAGTSCHRDRGTAAAAAEGGGDDDDWRWPLSPAGLGVAGPGRLQREVPDGAFGGPFGAKPNASIHNEDSSVAVSPRSRAVTQRTPRAVARARARVRT
jgi:hypothetical protein